MKITRIHYDNEKENNDLLVLLDEYARGEMGGGKSLSTYTQTNLLSVLSQRTDALSLIAYDGEIAMGLLNAFEGFSTFKCKALLNIHDVCVSPQYRRQGVATKLLQAAEQIARERNYCKLTLEVLQENTPALATYRRFGFEAYALDPAMGAAMFWEKDISL